MVKKINGVLHIIILISLICSISLFGNDSIDRQSKHSIGLNANLTSAPGLSYRYLINQNYGFKFSSFVFYTEPRNSYFSFEGDVQRTLVQLNSNKMFLSVGASAFNIHNYSPYGFSGYTLSSDLGIETVLFNNITLGIEFGLAYYDTKLGDSAISSSSNGIKNNFGLSVLYGF